jgi:hypothetical protein
MYRHILSTYQNIPVEHHILYRGSDVSDMPWGCLQFCVAAVSQKLLPNNIIAFETFKIKPYIIINYFIILYILCKNVLK